MLPGTADPLPSLATLIAAAAAGVTSTITVEVRSALLPSTVTSWQPDVPPQLDSATLAVLLTVVAFATSDTFTRVNNRLRLPARNEKR